MVAMRDYTKLTRRLKANLETSNPTQPCQVQPRHQVVLHGVAGLEEQLASQIFSVGLCYYHPWQACGRPCFGASCDSSVVRLVTLSRPPLARGAIDMKRRVCMKRLRRLKCKCHETRHFVRNEMSRIVIFLSWKKVTNRYFFFVVRNGPNTVFLPIWTTM